MFLISILKNSLYIGSELNKNKLSLRKSCLKIKIIFKNRYKVTKILIFKLQKRNKSFKIIILKNKYIKGFKYKFP